MPKIHLSFSLAALLCACAHHGAPVNAAQFSTASPPSTCAFVGRASGSATEATEPQALRHARENLASDADRLGGSYVQVTGQDIAKVEMALNAIQVRLEARIYRCAELGDDAAPSSPVTTVLAEDAGGALAGDLGDAGPRAAPFPCPPSTEPRALDSADGPGWQCARKVADHWVAEGPYILSWSSGATRTEGSFENGKRSGRWSFYYANGQVRERAAFRDGQMDGCAEEFDADGSSLPPRCSDGGAPLPH
jgi:hypothetical protein